MPKFASSLAVRLITAVVIIPFLLVLVWMPQLSPIFVVAVAGLVLMGLREYYALARALGHLTAGFTGGVVGLLVLLSAGFHPEWLTPTVVLGMLAIAIVHLWTGRHRLGGVAASVFGVVYVPWLAAHVLLIHGIGPMGPGLTVLLLATVMASDTGAYFAGKGLGRHKLAPQISPNKTWEGSAGGLLAGMLAGVVVYTLEGHTPLTSHFPRWPLHIYLGVSAVLGILGQLGDLVESMLKRDAGVKDAGALFPGHGGVLDRCDGFLFAAPALYYMVLGMGDF